MNTADSSKPQLVRALKLRDLVLLNLVAVLGLRHLGVAAKAGPVTLTLWALAAMFFFVPLGLAVIELSSRFPNSGGIYDWTKRALGEKHAFLCGWCYWINNVLYYPSLLITTAAVVTYVFGYGGTWLEKDLAYVTVTTLVCLWLAVALNVLGIGTGKWLQNVGGLGTYLPGAIVIFVGAYAWLTKPSANTITAADLLPKSADYDSLNLWISVAFAYSGIELSAMLGGEVQNPQRNLPRSIYLAAPMIALLYLLGTASVLWLVPSKDINPLTGILQAAENGLGQIRFLSWVIPTCAALYAIGNVGSVGAWLTGPARVAFAIGLDRYFPPAFSKIHPRWRTPYIAIIVQASIATLLLLAFVFSKEREAKSVEQAYLILLSAQVFIYFIPYIYLFVVFLIHRQKNSNEGVMLVPGGKIGAYLLALSGLSVTIFAVVLTFVPPSDANVWDFELRLVVGIAALLALGGILFWRANQQNK